jgi:tRNA A-37 threonylcarbamoyl transferase component Bud32
MSTNPITNETSLKNRPGLRWTLIGIWVAVVAYMAIVLGAVLSPQFADFQNSNISRILLEIPALLQFGIEFGVDLLLIFGFSVIGVALIVHRSDDWFAIFTSLFLIAFGVRVTNLVNMIAITPGHETSGGLILATGDIGIVLFSMLFPDGKFVPRWLKFVAPLLVITMLGIYIFPNAPFFWNTMGRGGYLLATTTWYIIGLLSAVYRYICHATLAQKQQIRWAFIGTMGPFVWFLIFQVLFGGYLQMGDSTTLLSTSFQIVSRLAGIFLFLMLPLFITISIASAKLFDIDLLINRSLVYGILTIGLGLTFAMALGLISLIFKNFHQGDQSFVVATVFSVSAGALFQPARKKLQRFVDRFFYHIQIDYQKTPAEIRAESKTIITGTTLSSYHNLKLIGRGGMAEVYSATSPERKPVAIKVLRATLASDEQFRKRFVREADIVSGIEHPNIVRVMDFGDENGAYYIVMELLSGPDLNNLLRQEKQISLPQTVNLLRGVADALDYAHQLGLVHRDIKPSNVMLDSSTIPPRAVLTDFGIAKISDAHTKITTTGMLGTFDYIAPEQIQASAEVDGRADVYALGVMTYQLLTGRLPFERPNTGALLLAHLNAPPPDAREMLHGLSRSASYAIQKAMAKEPAARYTTAGGFITALECA